MVLAANVALIVAWPWLAPAIREFFDPLYTWLCHREPARCYALNGSPLPACARCVGVWLGLLVMAVLAGFVGLWRLRAGLMLFAWMVASWAVGSWLPASWHLERTVAGIAGGMGVYVLACRLPAYLRRVSRLV